MGWQPTKVPLRPFATLCPCCGRSDLRLVKHFCWLCLEYGCGDPDLTPCRVTQQLPQSAPQETTDA